MSGGEQSGFDQVRIPDDDGGTRVYTQGEFEQLGLAERVRLLMNTKIQFFRKGQPITAREALRGR